MTQHVRFSRILSSLLLIFSLSTCSLWNSWFGSEEIHVGAYKTLQAEDLAEGQQIKWIFAQLPDSSQIRGFLPSDTVATVSFQPDVPGDYEVVMQLINGDEVDESNLSFLAVIPEDTALVNTALPDHLIAYQEDKDTTTSETTAVTNFTETGDQRRYLEKIVDPNRSKATTKQKTVAARPKKTRSTPPESRGNLIPRAAKTYTIQVSSWPSLEEAQAASKELMDKYGIDSYIQRAFFKDKDEIYYRLRIGNFKGQSAAVAYAKEIQERTNLPVWVDYVRKEM